MIKSIKWELRKQIYRSRSVLIITPIVFAILFLLPRSLMRTQPYIMSTVIMILSLVLIWGTICPLIYSISNLTCDFGQNTYRLERSTGRSYLPIFLIKLLLNIVYVFMSTVVCIIGKYSAWKFNTENTEFFIIRLNRPYYVFVLEFAIFYPVTLLFVYLLVIKLKSVYIAVFVVLTAIILYWSTSLWKETKMLYLTAIVVLCAIMLYGANKLVQTRGAHLNKIVKSN